MRFVKDVFQRPRCSAGWVEPRGRRRRFVETGPTTNREQAKILASGKAENLPPSLPSLKMDPGTLQAIGPGGDPAGAVGLRAGVDKGRNIQDGLE